MANLVSLIAVPHDPTLPIAARMAEQGRADPAALPALENFKTLRAQLTTAKPDAIIMVGSDHMNQWFLNNMAPFMIGKAPRLLGPFPGEISSWGLRNCDLPIDGVLARHLIRNGYEHSVDFAFSDEFVADHSFTIPLNFLRPEGDLPVVPVFINLLAPPVPPGRRYAAVGDTLRAGVESAPGDQRIAMIVTGHMSNNVGGPGMMSITKKPKSRWDSEIWLLIEENRVDEILARSTWDQLYAYGNGTPGFLAYCLAFGAARGSAPSFADLVATTAQPPCAFLAWDETALNWGTR